VRDAMRTILRRLCRPVVSGGLAAGLVLLLLCYHGGRQVGHAQSLAGPADAAQQATGAVDNEVLRAEGLSRVFRRAAQKVLPAVVVIKAGPSPVCPRCGRAHEAPEGEADEAGADSGRQKRLDVLGSGFLVASTGVVLTNKHVVEGNPRLVVQTADGKQFPVKQVSTDREYDAAVLRIDANGPLPFVRLGDSEAAEIGDWVLTIGSPLELDQTVSAGIISAKNRSICPTHQARYLQTDAVVNPGSSGGPLVALNGNVIGITTAIASEDGGYQGIGFAIPAHLIKKLVEQSTESGTNERASREPGERS
jgi:serine protease Do